MKKPNLKREFFVDAGGINRMQLLPSFKTSLFKGGVKMICINCGEWVFSDFENYFYCPFCQEYLPSYSTYIH